MRHPLFAADPQGYQEYTSIVSGWSSATIASSGNAHAKLHYGNDDDRNLQFTTILGFLGMMRPHSLQGLRPESFHIVTSNGTVNPMSNQQDIFHEELVNLLHKEKIVGYYVEFRSKTMAKARAHFPLLSTNVLLSAICPVRALIDVSQRGLIKKGFLNSINKQQKLKEVFAELNGTRATHCPLRDEDWWENLVLGPGNGPPARRFPRDMEVSRGVGSVLPRRPTISIPTSNSIFHRDSGFSTKRRYNIV